MKYKNKKSDGFEMTYLLPMFLIVIIIPLLTKGHFVQVKEPEFIKLIGNTLVDFFSYHKSIWLITLTAIAILPSFLFVLPRKKHLLNFTYDKVLIPMIIFIILALLSFALSSFKNIALWGAYDRSEGLVVLLCYCFLFITSYYVFRDTKCFDQLIKYLKVCVVLMSVVGFSQFLGRDILFSPFLKSLILPPEILASGNEMKLALEKTVVYGTLYNSNYVGSFAAMLLALFSGMGLAAKGKQLKMEYGFYSMLCFALLLGSRSRAGMVGLVLALLFAVIIYWQEIKNNFKWITLVCGLLGILALSMNYSTGGLVLNKLTSLSFDPRIEATRIDELKDIQLSKDKVSIILKNETLNILRDAKKMVVFADTDGKLLDVSVSGQGEIRFKDGRYKAFMLQIGKNKYESMMRITFGPKEIFIGMNNDMHFLNARQEPTKLEEVKSFGFKGKESWGSARGYIWSRTLPLLENTLFIGHGPDTFALYFPQDDYVGKLKAYDTYKIVVDKPHNWYLQTAINTGVLSLLALLALIGAYFMKTYCVFKGYRVQVATDESHKYANELAKAILIAVIAYLGAAFFNDSVVGVAPVFWILFGSGMGMNTQLLMDIKKK